jgi:hypothetical protein
MHDETTGTIGHDEALPAPDCDAIVAHTLPLSSPNPLHTDTAYSGQQVTRSSGDNVTAFVTCDACNGRGTHAHFPLRNCTVCCGSGWL